VIKHADHIGAAWVEIEKELEELGSRN